MYSNNNSEIYADNISLNSTTSTLINSPQIILGQDSKSNQYPTQPAILGNNLENILVNLIDALSGFATDVSAAVSTPQGTPIVTLVNAGFSLSNKLSSIIDELETIKSNVVFLNN
jgi:hypothetical protein